MRAQGGRGSGECGGIGGLGKGMGPEVGEGERGKGGEVEKWDWDLVTYFLVR